MNNAEREWYARRLHVTPVSHEQSNRVFKQVDSFKKRHPDEMNHLEKQINDYCAYSKENSASRAMKRRIRDVLLRSVKKVFSNGALVPVGSTVTRLCVRGSDLDMCLCVPDKEGVYDNDHEFVLETLQQLYDELTTNKPDIIGLSRFISQTTVPIIRIYLVGEYESIEVDINCNVIAQFYSNHLVQHYVRFDNRVQPLILAIKNWASNAAILDSQHGRLNSFSFVMMTIHFLQSVCSPPILPNLNGMFPHIFKPFIRLELISGPHERCVPSNFGLEPNHRSVSELLLGFIAYFAEFDWDQYAIVIRLGKLVTRDYEIEEGAFEMYIEEPYDRFNTTRTVKSRANRDGIARTIDDTYRGIFVDQSVNIMHLLNTGD